MFMLQNQENVDEFIKNYEHIFYCEIIVLEDGKIIRAIPSHVETLRMIYEKRHHLKEKESWDIMPIWEVPINWYVEQLKVVSVWYKSYAAPKSGMSEAQVETIKRLADAGKVEISLQS